MVLASTPVVSDSRLAAGRVGGAQQAPHLLGPEDDQDGVDQGRLADALPAGDDQRPAGQGLLRAVCWLSASSLRVLPWHHPKALSTSMGG